QVEGFLGQSQHLEGGPADDGRGTLVVGQQAHLAEDRAAAEPGNGHVATGQIAADLHFAGADDKQMRGDIALADDDLSRLIPADLHERREGAQFRAIQTMKEAMVSPRPVAWDELLDRLAVHQPTLSSGNAFTCRRRIAWPAE